MAKIRERDRKAILEALAGGVTPRQGIQHIQVGRLDETAAIVDDINRISEGGAAVRVLIGNFGSGKTFFLTLIKVLALKRNMFVMTADFSPDRRLYSSSGKALALYRELVRSLSSATHPDGGALEELLDAVSEKTSLGDTEFLTRLRSLPYGYDAVTVLSKWYVAKNPQTDKEKRDSFIVKDACLRWFAGELTNENKRLLGVKSAIADDGSYDALKLIARLCHECGYSGLFVELDECVNLSKISNATSRDRNYEQILRIINECLQGDAKYIGFIFGGTPDFLMDTRRGLYSYDALRSRLRTSEFTDKVDVDTTGPTINLQPLSEEDLLVLLGNITNVEALNDKQAWLVNDDDMQRFLKKHFDTLGADYYRTPREIIRSFVAMLKMLRDNPELSVDDVLGQVKVVKEKKESGLSSVTTRMAQQDSGIGFEEDDDEDFGF